MQVLSWNYVEPVFRPPSEAYSLILQVTNGCSWNRCSYCEMYQAPQKRFAVKRRAEIEREIEQAGHLWPETRRVFLADGDAMVLSTGRLLEILSAIREHLPQVTRVGAYCLPRNLRRKSVVELGELRAAGLGILYVGAESGDDEVLARISKGETFASTAAALGKIREAGIKSLVMILNGLGGEILSRRHALASARLANETQPDYLATLVLSFPRGDQRFRRGYPEGFRLPAMQGLFLELELLIEHSDLERTVFRSDHASNYLPLKGVLDRDREALLERLRRARAHPEQAGLRSEWQRGL